MSSTDWGQTQDALAIAFRVRCAPIPHINQLTHDLLHFLLRRADDVKLQRRRQDPDSRTAGTLLVAALAAPALVQLATDSSRAVAAVLASLHKIRQLEPPETLWRWAVSEAWDYTSLAFSKAGS